MRIGRPTKRDEETVGLVVEAIRRGATRAEAARAARISKSTLMAWLAKGWDGEAGYASFLSAVRLAERIGVPREPFSIRAWEKERRRAELPTYARLTTDPDLRARRLARKRAGRTRVEANGPETLLNLTSVPGSTAPAPTPSEPD